MLQQYREFLWVPSLTVYVAGAILFKARVLPSIRDTLKRDGKLPDSLCFSLAALMVFYSGDTDENGKLTAKRGWIGFNAGAIASGGSVNKMRNGL